MGYVIATILGLALGSLVVAILARVQIRRSLAKARMAERRARASERLAELGAMTSGLAHEIKNPLSTIGLNAQLLGEGIEDLPSGAPVVEDEKQRLSRRAASLRREVERLRGILTDFLTYAGELRLDQKPADVNQVVDELAEFFSPQTQQQGVRLRTDLSPGPLAANLDAPLMKQAVLNLMLNAVQAMAPLATTGAVSHSHAAGHARTKQSNGATRELILRTGRVRDADGVESIQLHVIDTGPGITPEVAARLFTPYFTTKAGGSGLGLPTTRRIVEAHQGRIDVHTEPGKGTDFVVTLPASQA
ncbi:Sensor protein ZraS [Phycisphaerales bacterium]|nr:Sensor protein ZraS [Phycisphaerales bacterium]